MRLLIHKIVAFFMLGVIFTVSTGMGFIEHSCQMKEEKVIVLSKKKSCCSAKTSCEQPTSQSQTTFKKPACCEDKTVYLHIDLAGYSQKLTKFISLAFTAVVQNFFTLVHKLVINEEEACGYTNTSPPQTGRDTLTKKRTLQI
ncbi:hypothetical protein QNI19_17300 [Cytophagaceae bacterium DM2B3-1]|uniref:Uncharacterized protein n=1 Tax=Xanthocytophaga flava TaxID=3048013 RepID=A0ABT7CLW8_9BACT|nr:hypothetical protein [Xanthocytophaga flavus]MDJ1494698.1 hypothetical protein [Xanthocytophaga flavus]